MINIKNSAGFPPRAISLHFSFILLFLPFRGMLSRRFVHCAAYYAAFLLPLGRMSSDDFFQKIPFSLLSHPLKFAYIKYFLYLCTRFKYQISPENGAQLVHSLSFLDNARFEHDIINTYTIRYDTCQST